VEEEERHRPPATHTQLHGNPWPVEHEACSHFGRRDGDSTHSSRSQLWHWGCPRRFARGSTSHEPLPSCLGAMRTYHTHTAGRV